MGTIISRFAKTPTSDDNPECIVISAETYKCIEISAFVPSCVNIQSSTPSNPAPPYPPERPELPPSEAPILSSLETCVADGDTIGVLIENFDENANYVNLRATNDFLSPPYLYGDTIVWTFDNDIECGETETVSIQVIQQDKSISPKGSYSVVGKCKIDTPVISGSSLVDEYSTVILTIENYDANYSYEVSDVSVGTAEIVDSTIEWFIPRVTSSVTGGTIKVIATSPTEPCKLPSDEGQHTINITQDGKTGTVTVRIQYTAEATTGAYRTIEVGGVIVSTEVLLYVPDAYSGSSRTRRRSYYYNYDTESYTLYYDSGYAFVDYKPYEYIINNTSFDPAYPFL